MRHNHFDLERNQLYREIAIQLGLPREEIRPEASLQRDLGIDSLDTLELVDALEQDFDVRVPDAALAKIETVADLEHCMVRWSGAIATDHDPG